MNILEAQKAIDKYCINKGTELVRFNVLHESTERDCVIGEVHLYYYKIKYLVKKYMLLLKIQELNMLYCKQINSFCTNEVLKFLNALELRNIIFICKNYSQ